MSASSPSLRVLLADDHAMVRDALARVLQSSGAIKVLGQASRGEEMFRLVSEIRPDCLILDYSMPELEMPGAIRKLLDLYPDLRILVLTVHQNIQYAVSVLEAGAHGYIIKAAAVEELVEAIHVVCRGDLYISKQLSQDVLKTLRSPRRERKGLESLSQRELEVMRMIVSGKSLQQCALMMDLSTSTVSTYRTRILEKLGLETTAELIRYGLQNGMNI
jgi:two-component system, NarL family, invasion response regulator UvrY